MRNSERFIVFIEKRHPDRGFLVDTHSIVYLKSPSGESSERLRQYSSAVEIGNLTPDRISYEEDTFGIVNPKPCVLMVNCDDFIESQLGAKGIETESARVLLNLASSFNNLSIEAARGKWDWNKPATRGVENGWDKWLFIAAWLWSAWKGIPHATRHSLMLRLGYPEDQRAFRTMLSRARLVEKNRDSAKGSGSCYR